DHPARAASVQQLQSLFDHLAAMDVPSSAYQLDLSLARGMDYYTGPIFETVVHEPKIGSICGGGRYDKLIGLFAAHDEPATGVSFGLERIIDVIQELHLAQGVRSTVAQVLVTLFSPDAVAASLRLATQLRQAQLSVEVYPAPERLGVQLRYATRKGIPLAIILGPDELATGTAVVKNLLRDEQQAVSHGEIARYVKTLVEAASTTLGSASSFPQKDTPPA
ncbi:MAG: ATP phosphoribosyltransferase regulatory subunit, partial [Chloroflexi bacterium]|nr:ATP phosphoribosyltransferase regulatory subunit [Chloroflexota bacterium]